LKRLVGHPEKAELGQVAGMTQYEAPGVKGQRMSFATLIIDKKILELPQTVRRCIQSKASTIKDFLKIL
jgi:hypothetical protein